MEFKSFFKDRKIFVTGHTGFIGGWLIKCLRLFGSEVCGYALKPRTVPNLYETLDVGSEILDVRGNVTDKNLLKNTIQRFRPEIVFHLAAQLSSFFALLMSS